jgi:hypothetical protein
LPNVSYMKHMKPTKPTATIKTESSINPKRV